MFWTIISAVIVGLIAIYLGIAGRRSGRGTPVR